MRCSAFLLLQLFTSYSIEESSSQSRALHTRLTNLSVGLEVEGEIVGHHGAIGLHQNVSWLGRTALQETEAWLQRENHLRHHSLED